MTLRKHFSLLCFSLPLLLSGLFSCRPTASVIQTTPVANLQSYNIALVRVASTPSLQSYERLLEFSTSDFIQKKCNFSQVLNPSQLGSTTPDLILDLNIKNARRGGDSFVQNDNISTVEVTLVLSDGVDQSLLGSADIIGKSSAIPITITVSSEEADPEKQALQAVAKRVADILGQSGCVGQRIERKINTNSSIDASSSEARIQAESANDEGKRLFRAAQIPAAKAQFIIAIQTLPDPKYQFNLCLAYEALSELEDATLACQAVLHAKPPERLASKARQRLAIIAEKRTP